MQAQATSRFFGMEIVETALVPSGSDETVEYMVCSDTRSYGSQGHRTVRMDDRYFSAESSFDEALTKWPDGCTVIVPEILSLTRQTWKKTKKRAARSGGSESHSSKDARRWELRWW